MPCFLGDKIVCLSGDITSTMSPLPLMTLLWPITKSFPQAYVSLFMNWASRSSDNDTRASSPKGSAMFSAPSWYVIPDDSSTKMLKFCPFRTELTLNTWLCTSGDSWQSAKSWFKGVGSWKRPSGVSPQRNSSFGEPSSCGSTRIDANLVASTCSILTRRSNCATDWNVVMKSV